MLTARALALLSALAAVLVLAATAFALTPNGSVVAPLPVQDLALTGRSAAYVADTPSALRCGRVGLWNTKTGRGFSIDAKELCLEQTSTGQGIWDVTVATKRILWLTYAGGNFREWFLWTATATRTRPLQLRFVSRPVEDPPPIVIGPGTAQGIPYAVDRQIVYLGDDGKAISKTIVASPVRALAAGAGPGRLEIAALLASGRVVGLDSAGGEVTPPEPYPLKAVVALRVCSLGTAVQVGDEVEILPPRSHDGVVVRLPAGATMVDVAQGRVLWTRAGDLGATTIATGRSMDLVDGTPEKPVHGQLEIGGLAWATGRSVRWRTGLLR